MSNRFPVMGLDMFGDEIKQKKSGPIGERFEFAPFSVLDARAGDWQERKRAWLSVGIEGEIGRTDLTNGKSRQTSSLYFVKNAAGTMQRAGEIVEGGDVGNSASIFDPVLCEMAYRWFVPPGGQIVDPFAGGSVRGIVAALLGFDYWGCDLRAEQIEANREQAAEICTEPTPTWVEGDAIDVLDDAPLADFVFSCPPYGDLERYSDNPRDLSTMEYHTFLAAYKRIILRVTKQLKSDRFACFAVSDFRDKRTGNYRGFVADTINAFREVGMELYNDAVLVQPVGSLPIRVTKQFDASRKLGKTHQNLLVFIKGDGKRAAQAVR